MLNISNYYDNKKNTIEWYCHLEKTSVVREGKYD